MIAILASRIDRQNEADARPRACASPACGRPVSRICHRPSRHCVRSARRRRRGDLHRAGCSRDRAEARGPACRRLSQAVEPTAGDAVAHPPPPARTGVTLQGEDGPAAQMLEVMIESDLPRPSASRAAAAARAALTARRRQRCACGALAELAWRPRSRREHALDAALLTAGDAPESRPRRGRPARDRRRGRRADAKIRLLRRARRSRAPTSRTTRARSPSPGHLSRSDEGPEGGARAAKKLDRDLRAAKREAERCRLSSAGNLEEAPAAKRARWSKPRASRTGDRRSRSCRQGAAALLADVPSDVEVALAAHREPTLPRRLEGARRGPRCPRPSDEQRGRGGERPRRDRSSVCAHSQRPPARDRRLPRRHREPRQLGRAGGRALRDARRRGP